MGRSLVAGRALLVAACLAAIDAGAQYETSARSFVTQLVDAINSRVVERRKALLHTRSLACQTSGQNAAIVEGFVRQANQPIPAGYRWRMKPIPLDQPTLLSDRYEYPVVPTHLLEIDFASGPHSSTSLIVQIARDRGDWREVAACPRRAGSVPPP
jgi:hypothetical protein